MNQAKGDLNKIHKEQLELKKAEQQIKIILEKINSQVNKLIVEELQLRSQDCENTATGLESKSSDIDNQTFKESISEINSQQLNLDVKPNVFKVLEETDDDDDSVKHVTIL